jgi:hypothetical protein
MVVKSFMTMCTSYKVSYSKKHSSLLLDVVLYNKTFYILCFKFIVYNIGIKYSKNLSKL